jgi:hypothetical protein
MPEVFLRSRDTVLPVRQDFQHRRGAHIHRWYEKEVITREEYPRRTVLKRR